jgi:2,4-dienoyl-CoA reductase-like NADH-dependent reductase (Old Yellow Enzyme family)
MLEDPIVLPCGLTLANRLTKAATTEALATPEAEVSQELITLYGRWARSGVGLIITGNIGIDVEHVVRPGDVVVSPSTPLEPLRRWSTLARSGGAKVILQICHAGRQTQRWRNARPIAPSAVQAVKTLRAFGKPRAATAQEIEDIRERFVRAALLAEEAGFDGCQIHSAHGYLLSQFLSPLTNQRDDQWGGSIENRARLLLDIVRAVKARRRSSGFAVTVKLNSADFQRGGLTAEESLRVVELLDAEGIDLLEISGGTYEQGASFGHGVERTASTLAREAYFLDFSRRARERTRIPLLLTGGFRSRQAMEQALAEGALDLVGVARPFCVEPELGQRLLADPNARITTRQRWPGPKAVHGFAEMAWYSEQLQRMGRGLAPDPEMSATAAMMRHFWRDLSRGLSRPTRGFASLPWSNQEQRKSPEPAQLKQGTG